MEANYGVLPDEEWDFLSKMFSTEELDFAHQFLGQFPDHEHEDKNFTFQSNVEASMNAVKDNESPFNSVHALTTNMQYSSQNGAYGSSAFAHENFHTFVSDQVVASEDMNYMPMHCAASGHVFSHGAMEENAGFNRGHELQLKRKCDVPEPHVGAAFQGSKKPRVATHAKRNQKLSPKGICEEENNCGHSYSSEDDSASQELNVGATSDSKATAPLNSNGKTRASRGSATDPQSLYARRRRERINERLKILQRLVPNGTKVDISTMLEEAVHYVKFLQLQIKLLSSDDLWMYAPIVYNGMDIGFNQKISPSR